MPLTSSNCEGQDEAAVTERRPAATPVTDGFSVGRRSFNEIFQMAVLETQLAILDGRIPAWILTPGNLLQRRQQTPAARTTRTVITPYQRLLDYIIPDFRSRGFTMAESSARATANSRSRLDEMVTTGLLTEKRSQF